MANRFFKQLLTEQIELFIYSFSQTSRSLFFDEQTKQLVHPGDYGSYREAICKKFLRFIVPTRLDIGRGFIINNSDEISTECDIIVYDSKLTPLIQNPEFQRFYPIETVSAVGEVKSVLKKQQFENAINKLTNFKKIRESIYDPVVAYKSGQYSNLYIPHLSSQDQIFTFLICQKLDFNLEEIPRRINQMYKPETPYRYRHNLVLSIEDKIIFLYRSVDDRSLMYPTYPIIPKPGVRQPISSESLKNRLIRSSEEDPLDVFYIFATYLNTGISSTTILYPDMAHYFGLLFGGNIYDEP